MCWLVLLQAVYWFPYRVFHFTILWLAVKHASMSASDCYRHRHEVEGSRSTYLSDALLGEPGNPVPKGLLPLRA